MSNHTQRLEAIREGIISAMHEKGMIPEGEHGGVYNDNCPFCNEFIRHSEFLTPDQLMISKTSEVMLSAIDQYTQRLVLEREMEMLTGWLSWVRSGGGHIDRRRLEVSITETQSQLDKLNGDKK